MGSGTVSNRDADGGPGRPVKDGGLGYSCIAEVRVVETMLKGKPETGFLGHGDVVRIEMADAKGHSIFGAIEQTVAADLSLSTLGAHGGRDKPGHDGVGGGSSCRASLTPPPHPPY